MTPEDMAPHFASFGQGVHIGSNVKFAHPEKIHIGNGVVIDDLAYVDATHGREIRIGDGCRIARGTQLVCSGAGFEDGFIHIGKCTNTGFFNVLAGHAGLTIGEYVLVAAHCVLNGYKHGYERPDIPMRFQPDSAEPVVVEDDVYIATGAMVMGVRLGAGAVVAAHALVTHDVPALAIVAGVPARVVGSREAGSRIDPALQQAIAVA